MAFPLDAEYFDNFPVIWGDMHDDIAGCQYLCPELTESIVTLYARLSMEKSSLTVRLFHTSTMGLWGMVSQVSHSI